VTMPRGRTAGAIRSRASSVLLAAGLAVVLAGQAVAASPTPDAGGGDPRSPGQGPGLVGDPLTAVLIVLAIAIASVGATLVWVRLTGQRGRDGG
jgi:hypothetical protein